MAARFAYSWESTEDEIIRLCHYISDDSTVAAYFGTSKERVAKVRRKITHGRPYLRTGQDVTSETAINASTQKAEREATEGSAQLLERLNMLFRKYGKKHGIGTDEAQVVQLFGWRILNRLKAGA